MRLARSVVSFAALLTLVGASGDRAPPRGPCAARGRTDAHRRAGAPVARRRQDHRRPRVQRPGARPHARVSRGRSRRDPLSQPPVRDHHHPLARAAHSRLDGRQPAESGRSRRLVRLRVRHPARRGRHVLVSPASGPSHRLSGREGTVRRDHHSRRRRSAGRHPEKLLVLADNRFTADGQVDLPPPESPQGRLDEENGREGQRAVRQRPDHADDLRSGAARCSGGASSTRRRRASTASRSPARSSCRWAPTAACSSARCRCTRSCWPTATRVEAARARHRRAGQPRRAADAARTTGTSRRPGRPTGTSPRDLLTLQYTDEAPRRARRRAGAAARRAGARHDEGRPPGASSCSARD